jgi:adenylosuccinate synthase
MSNASLILDCQFGSTGKGLFAGFLAAKHDPDVIAYAPSPNAGHTLIWKGRTIIHKMLPSGITSRRLKTIVLGPGSLLDLDRLAEEWAALERPVELLIHRNAACVLPRHRQAESQGNTAPGSTRQGVGAAQIERIRRSPQSQNLARHCLVGHPLQEVARLIDTPEMQRVYFDAERLQIESCQGYSLSILHGFYPHVTSRDVTTASVLQDTGVPWTKSLTVYGTFRTYPIRVANRPESGEWSGPGYPDCQETSFESLGQPQEVTTVTKLPRRIFTWSQQQTLEACAQNHVDYAFLNFAQYPPTFKELLHIWESLNEATVVSYLGFGPEIEDVLRVGAPNVCQSYARVIWERYRAAADGDS